MKVIWLILSLAVLTPLSFATSEKEFFIVPLKYREAEDMVAPLSGLFRGKANFSTLQGKLLVSCSNEIFKSIQKVVAELDHRQKQFKIELITATEEEANRLNRGVTIQAKSKNGKVQIGSPSPAPVLQIGKNVEIGISLEEENRILLGKDKRSITVSEGSMGELSFGAKGSRLKVSPRLQGAKGIEITISQVLTIGGQEKSLQTIRAGELEQWLDLGGLNIDSDSNLGTIAHKESTQNVDQTRYWIRAKEIEP